MKNMEDKFGKDPLGPVEKKIAYLYIGEQRICLKNLPI
jgi:hypothetical protein